MKSSGADSNVSRRPRRRMKCYVVAVLSTLRPGVREEEASATAWQSVNVALPSAWVSVEGVQRRVLVDTGCSRSIAHVSCCKTWTKDSISMLTESGQEWRCEGTYPVRLQLGSGAAAEVRVSDCQEAPRVYVHFRHGRYKSARRSHI